MGRLIVVFTLSRIREIIDLPTTFCARLDMFMSSSAFRRGWGVR